MNKNKLKTDKYLTGFKKYVSIESAIKHIADFFEEEESFFSRRSSKSSAPLSENFGPYELFKFSEAMNLYNNVVMNYGSESGYARDLLQEFLKNGNRKQIAKAPAIDEVEALRLRFPNFSQAIDQLAAATALSHLSNQQYFVMKPLLLLGPAGVGKTAFCQSVAKLLNVPFKRFDIAQMTSNAILSGLSLSWSSGQPGELLRYMSSSPVINPMILFDEIDKAAGHVHHPIEPTLLTLLEPESARAFKDEAMKLSFDCQHILCFATANDALSMSQPLLSRFDVVQIRKPNQLETRVIIKNMYQDFLKNHAWGKLFSTALDDKVVDRLVEYTPRRIKAILQAAFGKAARRNSNEIGVMDIENLQYEETSRRIGFV